MSRYLGWNEAEMRNVPPEIPQKKRRLDTVESLTPPRILASFTPVNQSNLTTFPVTKPLGAPARRKERRSIYDLPDEDMSTALPLGNWRKDDPMTPPPATHGTWPALTPLPIINAPSKLSTPPDSNLRNVHKIRQYMNMVPDGTVKTHQLRPASWTTTKDIFSRADFPCRQTTLDKLAAFRYNEPKERSADRSHWIAEDKLEASALETIYGDDRPSVEHKTTISPGNEVAMEEAASLDDMQWQDISLLEDESDDEFPMLENEVAEMLRLQTPESQNEELISPTPSQTPDGQNFPNHGARHDQIPSSSISISSPSKTILSMDRNSRTIQPFPIPSLTSSPSPSPQFSNPPLEHQPSHSPLARFARPPFPTQVSPRSPIDGISASKRLRTCFRIGEAQSGSKARAEAQVEIIIELFARIQQSGKSPSGAVYDFQFRDLFHDGPPFLKGKLEGVKRNGLVEVECEALLGEGAVGRMVRCLGRWSRGEFGLICVRATDWEEVRWTRGIVGEVVVGDAFALSSPSSAASSSSSSSAHSFLT